MADPSSKLDAAANPQTRCSNCQTVFEVSRELLSSSDTRVRCGECLSIFDALEEIRLAEQKVREESDVTAAKAAGLAKSASNTANGSSAAGGVKSEAAALDVTYSDFDIFSEDADLPEIAYFDQTRDTPDFDFDAVEMGNDETFNDFLFVRDVTIDADANALRSKPLENEAQSGSAYAEVDFVADEHPREPLIFNYRDGERPAAIPADGAAVAPATNVIPANLVPVDAHAKTALAPAPKLDVGKPAKASDSTSSRGGGSPWLFRLGMLMLLGVLLGALFVYRTRPQLYNNPTMRPMLEAGCNILRCTLPARIDVGSLKMVKRNVYSHPSTPNALVINVSFRNEANFAQQLPILHMVLSNRVGRTVAKQDFSPSSYMPNWEEGAVIESNQQLDVKLEVNDPGEDAQSFEFYFREIKS